MKCKYLKVGTGAAGLDMKRLFKSGAELLLIALAHAHYDIVRPACALDTHAQGSWGRRSWKQWLTKISTRFHPGLCQGECLD